MPSEQVGKRKPGRVPPPKCKAILLCEKTIVEEGTGKVSLINTVDSFMVREFPGSAPEFSVFLELVDGVGRYTVVVEVHDLEQDAVLARSSEATLDWRDRLGRFKIIVPFARVAADHPGVYDLVVFANDEEVERQTFRVAESGSREQEGGTA